MITVKLTEEQMVLVRTLLKSNIEILACNLSYTGVRPDDIICSAQEIEESAEILKLLMKKK